MDERNLSYLELAKQKEEIKLCTISVRELNLLIYAYGEK